MRVLKMRFQFNVIKYITFILTVSLIEYNYLLSVEAIKIITSICGDII
jgi:hypothetical protein